MQLTALYTVGKVGGLMIGTSHLIITLDIIGVSAASPTLAVKTENCLFTYIYIYIYMVCTYSVYRKLWLLGAPCY